MPLTEVRRVPTGRARYIHIQTLWMLEMSVSSEIFNVFPVDASQIFTDFSKP